MEVCKTNKMKLGVLFSGSLSYKEILGKELTFLEKVKLKINQIKQTK